MNLKNAHEGQVRKAVSRILFTFLLLLKNLAELGMNSTIISAGLLHDVLEYKNK